MAQTGESTGSVEIGGAAEVMCSHHQMRLKAGLGKALLAPPSQTIGAFPGSENSLYMGTSLAKSPIAFRLVTLGHLLRKYASDPRQHELAIALRKVGLVERTLFIVDWLLDINVRPRANIGLNMVEVLHAY